MLKKRLAVTLLILLFISSALLAASLLKQPEDNTAQGSIQTGPAPGAAGGTDLQEAAELLDARLNLIYVFDSEQEKINLLVLEALNPVTEKQWYITIPAGTRYLMSQQLYGELSAICPQHPQLVVLSELYGYYGGRQCFEHGLDIVGELAGAEIEYYTTVTEEQFEGIFTSQDSKAGVLLEFSENVRENALQEGSVKTFISACYDGLSTSWSLADRLVYLELYDRMEADDTYFMAAEGSYGSTGFDADAQELSRLLSEICGD